MEKRLVALLQAKDSLEAYLALCAQKGILSEEDALAADSVSKSNYAYPTAQSKLEGRNLFFYLYLPACCLLTGVPQCGAEAHLQDRPVQEGPRGKGKDIRTAAFAAYNAG